MTSPESHPYRIEFLRFEADSPVRGAVRERCHTWQPIPGLTTGEARAIQGDALDHPVTWSSPADLNKVLGQEIRLKLHMIRSRTHAMTFNDAERPLGAVEPEYRHDVNADSAPKLN